MAKKIENKYILEQFQETSTAEVVAINRVTGLELFMGTLESDELSHSVEEEPIKGGIWNDTISTINKNKEIKFKVVDVVSRFDVQMQKLGAKMNNGSVLAWHFPHNYTVKAGAMEAGGTIDLDEIPFDENEVCIYDNKTKKKLVPTTDYTISSKKVTFTREASVKANDTVFVTSYQYSKEGVDYADISGKPLPQSYALVVRKPLFNVDDELVAWKVYYFPKAKMSSSFTLSGNTNKTKNTEETEFTIEKDIASEFLGRIMFIPEATE